jgi:hypothetical protein
MSLFFLLPVGGGTTFTYNLAGGPVSVTAGGPSDGNTMFRFNSDGTVDVSAGASSSTNYSPDNALTDWIVPNINHEDSDHWIRATDNGAKTATDWQYTAEAVFGSWAKLTGTSEQALELGYISVASSIDHSASILIEISTDSGGSTVVASATYTFDLDLAP